MINAKELRPGNWVMSNEDGQWNMQQIEYVAKDCQGYTGWFIALPNGSCTIEPSNFDEDYEWLIKPIPLTPEIFQACEFMFYNNEKVDWVYPTDHGRDIGFKKFHAMDGYYAVMGEWKPEVKYLHQLQNLIFSISGEELTYKP